MPVDPSAGIEITAFAWVPEFAKGFVRDLRPRWACEELGLSYRVRLLDALNPRPAAYLREQPWGQVPVMRADGVAYFESGAILLALAERNETLLPRDPQRRAQTISWLFAAFNSVEPFVFELGNVDIFSVGEEWARLRRPGRIKFLGARLDRVSDALDDKPYVAGGFTVADIAMATVLRALVASGLVAERPRLQAYLDRCTDRPAFQAALAAQLAVFEEHELQKENA
jgi:glutathione S-transferase